MSQKNPHVCPWYLGYFLLNPLRKFRHNPQQLFGSILKPGMQALDYGPGMGYFSIPMARMVGKGGKVYCIDLQEKMLRTLMKRAAKSKVEEIITPLLVGKNYDPEALASTIGFALLFAVVHEVPNPDRLFQDISTMLAPGGIAFFAEPKGHVSQASYEASLALAQKAGLKLDRRHNLPHEHAAFLVKS